MYFLFDYRNDYESGTVIGEVINGKPQVFDDDDGGVNFREITHHKSIEDCFKYLRTVYFREDFNEIKKRINILA